ncbi:MFS transporter [Glycomyces tarimensis]
MRQTPFRLLRAAVFAAVSVSASALLHVWGGGAAPRPDYFTAALALAFIAAFAAGGRQRGFAVLVPLCLLAQWGLHEVFSQGVAAAVHHHGGPAVSMLLVHAAAALAQASWLARGEAGLAALLDLLTLFFARVLRLRFGRAVVAVRPRVLRSSARRLRSLEPVPDAISRRGPPAFTL